MCKEYAPKDRPPRKTEATPEMILAGEMAWAAHDPDHFSRDEIIRAIWDAMIAARSAEEGHLAFPNPDPTNN
ncbi:MAG: hypothetical protein WBW73_10820 [Rhodoplanes sp.]